MRYRFYRAAVIAALVGFGLPGGGAAAELTREAVNRAAFESSANSPGRQSATMLRAQVLLDRAHISPGAIDGVAGENTVRAIKAFQQIHGLEPDGKLDEAIWQKLTAEGAAALVRYKIAEDDVGGPFMKSIPQSLEAMAKVDSLSYSSPAEVLAERFHMDEDLLRQINPGTDFSKAGISIVVANVRGKKPQAKAVRVVVSKSREAVIAYDGDGGIVAYYPATIGSNTLPSPNGETKVRAIASGPKYYYRPELDFEGAPEKSLTIPAGPNNPVGLVWIDLAKEGYGLHGTPEPTEIGKEFSHGCVRLTNWDVQELGELVRPGTPVEFVSG